MRLLQLLLIAILLAGSFPATALASVTVADGVIATQVVDRTPVAVAEIFPPTVGTLYCYTRLVGAADATSVTHVWFRGDEEMARVELPVHSGNWRTWSSKQILPAWIGTWRVEVRDAGGKVLQILPFTIQ